MKISNIQISSGNIARIAPNSLVPGQIIRAKVQASGHNHVMLRVGNYTIEAKTKLDLAAGTNLRLLVESVSDKLISLKAVPEGEIIKAETVLLTKLGFKPEKIIEAIVRQLLKFNLPVTQEAVLNLKSIINRYKLPKERWPVLIWLRSIGVEAASDQDMDSLERLFQFFRGELPEEEAELFVRFLKDQGNPASGFIKVYGQKYGSHWIYILNNGGQAENAQYDALTIVIKFKTIALGNFWVCLNQFSRRLNVSIVCDEKHNRIIRSEAEFLKVGLVSAGYSLGEIKVESRKINTVFDLIPESNQELFEINLTV